MKKQHKVAAAIAAAAGVLWWLHSRSSAKAFAAGRVSEAPFLGTGGLPK